MPRLARLWSWRWACSGCRTADYFLYSESFSEWHRSSRPSPILLRVDETHRRQSHRSDASLLLTAVPLALRDGEDPRARSIHIRLHQDGAPHAAAASCSSVAPLSLLATHRHRG